MMCAPSVNAICERAHGTGSTARVTGARSSTASSILPSPGHDRIIPRAAVAASAPARRASIVRHMSTFPPSPSTRSSPTARSARSSRPTAASSGCASPARIHRACSARSSTGPRACSGSVRRTRWSPTSAGTCPGTMVLETTWHTPTGWITVRDLLVMGPPDTASTPRRLQARARATWPRRGRCCAPRRASAAGSRSSSTACRCSTTDGRRAHGATAARATSSSRCSAVT